MLQVSGGGKPCDCAHPDQLAAWLNATANGDEQAFRRLYDATSPRLYALLLRILSTEAGAQDALQDAFVKVWQRADTYSPDRGAPLTWLLSIARYRALDLLGRKRPEVALPEDPDLAATLMVDEIGRGPDDHLETRPVGTRCRTPTGAACCWSTTTASPTRTCRARWPCRWARRRAGSGVA